MPASLSARSAAASRATSAINSAWVRLALAIALPVAVALVAAMAMPHGPATAFQALVTIGSSLLVGLISGRWLRSRWAVLVAPLLYVAAYELARLDAVGPTVDAPRLDETYGLLALALGRGLHGILALLPMAIGAAIGAGFARSRSSEATPGRVRPRVRIRWLVGLALVGLLAVVVALPASTPPILGADGQPEEDALAELSTVRLGGAEHRVLIRARDTDRPVLLWLAGGPGQTDMAAFRAVMDDLTHDFVVVNWDQRGTGGSYAAIDPASEMTLDRLVQDTIELTDHLRERFDEERIYLMGLSWGSTLGVLAAQRAPERYHAYIGNGQMVSQTETDRRLYDEMLALADARGDGELRARMEGYGRPPYADLPYANAFVMGYYGELEQPYTPSEAYLARGEESGLDAFGILGSEYDLMGKANVLRGLIDTFTVVYPQLQDIDFRRDVPRLEVPVYLVDGMAELAARRDLALEWFHRLEAPKKAILSVDGAAHAPALEQYEATHKFLVETVVAETYPS